MEIRKFLKMVGITSQKEIEKALREAIESGRHPGTGSLGAVMRLEIPGLGLVHVVEGEIRLE
jgi:hypothetical protein